MKWPTYPAHSAFIAGATARCELWRTMLGLVLLSGTYLFLFVVFAAALWALIAPPGTLSLMEAVAQGVPRPELTLVLLLSFLCLVLATAGTCIVLHGRSLMSLLGPKQLFLPQAAAAFIALIVLVVAVFLLPPWGYDEPLLRHLDFGVWLALLPLSLLAVLLQVSAEEIVFRGYLQQQLAARFGSPWVWLVLPSALFGYLHYTPEEAGSNAVIIAIHAGVFGVLMADLTARAGSLGPAIAAHFVNNAFAIVIIALPDLLGGLALYHLPFDLQDEARVAAWLPVDFALMVVSWLAIRVALKR